MKKVKGSSIQPVSEHIRELRWRLLLCCLVLVAASVVGYILHERLFRILSRPLGAPLYYTSPTGGFYALIKISILFGVLITIPVFIYQIGKFLSPAFRRRFRAFRVILTTAFLAILGVLFAYYIALPAALHFLANIDSSLQSLITINEYLNFVFSYVVGFALLFQLPLIMLFINRIKPQKPGQLMRIQRYVVLFSFVLAAIFTPTPDPINQLLMALPIILLYQLSVVLIWIANRKEKYATVELAVATPTAAEYSAEVYNAPTPVPSVNPQVSVPTPESRPKLIMDIHWQPTKTSL